MFKFRIVYISFLLFVLLFISCGKKKVYTNLEYRLLLELREMPKEVYRYPCAGGGFLQFQNWERAAQDTILILKFDENNRFEFYGGISIGEDYEKFVDMEIIKYNGDSFFAVRARNTGNANGNAVYMYYIDEQDCTLHPVEVVKASSLYSQTLSKDFWIWNDETINYEDDSITSEFYIWKQTDIHSKPTEGKVSVIYDIERTGKSNYRLYPKEMNFTEGTFEL